MKRIPIILRALKPVSGALIFSALMFGGLEPGHASVIPKASQRDCKKLLLRGDQLYKSGAFHGSLNFYQQAVNVEPASWEAHLKYGCALSRVARKDEALQELFQSIMLNADNPETNLIARSEIAAILMKQGNYDEAGGQLKQVLDLSPNDVSVRGNYAICLEHLGFFDLAIEQFKMIVKANPYDTVVLYNLGAAYLRKGQYPDAEKYFNRVVSIDGKHVLSYLGLASALMHEGNCDRALKYCQTAVSLQPNNHYAYLSMGEVYDKLGDEGRAVEAYKRAIQLNPRDNASKAALAKILESSKHLAGQGQLHATQ